MLAALAASGCQSDESPAEITAEGSIVGRISGYDPNRRISKLPVQIHFFDERRGLMATSDRGRFATSDGGSTWLRAGRVGRRRDLVGRRLPRAAIVDFEFVDHLHGWAASGHRLFRTANGGRTWRGLPLDCGGDAGLPAIAGVSFVDRETGFALCGGQPGAGQQLKMLKATADGGETWRVRAGPHDLPTSGYAGDVHFRTAQQGLMTTARGGIYRTRDGGRTWRLSLFTDQFTPESTAWPSRRRIYAALRNAGLVRSDDAGRRWQQIYPAPPGPPAAAMSFSSDERGIGIGIGGIFRDLGVILETADGGRSWSVRSRLRHLEIRQLERVSPMTVWAVAARRLRGGASGSVRILRSTDDGRTWLAIRSPRASLGTLSVVNARVAFLAANHGLLRTVDGGSTWRRSGASGGLYGARFLSEDRGFALSTAGQHLLSRTDDGGKSWERVPIRGGFRVLSISSRSPSHVWLVGNVCRSSSCRGRILRSKDGGRTWEEIRFRAAVPPEASHWLDTQRGFAPFGEGGHYRTSDGGRTWRFVEPE